jgi:hypothetical protein
VLLACHGAAATAGDRTKTTNYQDADNGAKKSSGVASKHSRVAQNAPLDRVAVAVDGAESSHGRDLAMWRLDPTGPQGPMQVSQAAATDVGGGDRFDVDQNRFIGRAYLALLYQKYRNWPDAIAAYNWGLGRMDAWLRAGRPADKLDNGVAVYLKRVLQESGLCIDTMPARHPPSTLPAANRSPSEGGNADLQAEQPAAPPDRLISAACTAGGVWGGAYNPGIGSSRFVKKLDQALQLTALRIRRGP